MKKIEIKKGVYFQNGMTLPPEVKQPTNREGDHKRGGTLPPQPKTSK